MSLKSTTLGDALEDAIVFVDGDWVESKDQDPNGDIRLIQLADIGDGDFINKSLRFLTSAKAKELKCTLLEEGDILIARMPDPLGRACIFPGLNQKCVTVVDVCIVRVNPKKIYNRYLMHALNSNDVRRKIERLATGTTRQRISRGNLKTVDIPLPPLEEQKRIADILDKADSLRAKRREAITLMNSLTQSIFLEMFGDPVTNPKSWPLKKFGGIGTLDRGVSKHRPRNAPELLGGTYPLVQTGEVANSEGYISSYSSTYSDLGLKQSKMWPAGTLCITIAANIAKTGILKFDACFPDSVVGFTDENPSTIEYVRVWLSFLQKMLEETAPESAQKNINLAILRNLNIPFPPLNLQEEFHQRIITVNSTKLSCKVALDTLEELFQSTQTKAFNGDL